MAWAVLLAGGGVPVAHGDVLPPEAYYAGLDTSDEAGLRAAVHALIRGHVRISYDNGNNWPILEAADALPGSPGTILDFYRNDAYATPSGRGGLYNREHMWPQSYGFPSSTDSVSGQGYYPRTDMHALFLTDSSYNSARGSSLFGTVGLPRSIRETVLNAGRGGGPQTYPGNHNWDATGADVWEVWNGRRGDAARALLYMDVRYAGGTHPVGATPEPDLILTDNDALVMPTTASTAYMGRLANVLAWNVEDAVDALERQHHEAVAAAQENRNPFIDYPSLAECLHGGDCTGVPPINPQGVAALRRSAGARLSWFAREEADLAGYHLYGATTSEGPWTRLNSTLLTGTFAEVSLTPAVESFLTVRAIDTEDNESPNGIVVSVTPGERIELLAESFEGPAGTDFTITGGTASEPQDYFGRFNFATAPSGLTVSTSGVQGVHFMAGEDTNSGGTSLPANGIHTVQLAPATTTGYSALEVSLLVGGSGAGYDSQALSNGDYLRVLVSVDGAADQLVGQLTKMAPSGSNGPLGIDRNLDGQAEESLDFSSGVVRVTFSIPAMGNTVVTRLVSRFDAGDEEIVYDDVRLSGVAPASGTNWIVY
jgi:endonuclease I